MSEVLPHMNREVTIRFMNTNIQRGFTIIELMIGIALLAVMATVAIPAFVGLVQNNQTITTANSFLDALSIARSEAVKRNQRVAVCGKSATQAACNATGNWEDGWTVFVDTDNGNDLDAGEIVILVEDGLPDGFTLREPSATYGDVITFQPTGETVQGLTAGLGSQAVFRLCRPDTDIAQSRAINLRATGRSVVTTGVAACP